MADRHEHEARELPPSNPPSDSDASSPSWLTYRLSTDTSFSPHGYEIGYWPANVDRSNPANFAVIEHVWGQAEAAERTTALNLQAAPKAKSASESSNEIGEEHEAGVPRGHARSHRR